MALPATRSSNEGRPVMASITLGGGTHPPLMKPAWATPDTRGRAPTDPRYRGLLVGKDDHPAAGEREIPIRGNEPRDPAFRPAASKVPTHRPRNPPNALRHRRPPRPCRPFTVDGQGTAPLTPPRGRFSAGLRFAQQGAPRLWVAGDGRPKALPGWKVGGPNRTEVLPFSTIAARVAGRSAALTQQYGSPKGPKPLGGPAAARPSNGRSGPRFRAAALAESTQRMAH